MRLNPCAIATPTAVDTAQSLPNRNQFPIGKEIEVSRSLTTKKLKLVIESGVAFQAGENSRVKEAPKCGHTHE